MDLCENTILHDSIFSLPFHEIINNNCMRKNILLLVAALCCLSCFAQNNQAVWNNGNLQFALPFNNVDSLTFPMENIEDADTLVMILPRHLKHIVRDTIYIHDTVYIHDCRGEYNTLAGLFSVSETQQVKFASGNLQYIRSSNLWSFAQHQYDMLGTDNVFGDSVTYKEPDKDFYSHNENYGYSKKGVFLADRIDLFGWSADNTTAPYGVSDSTSASVYAGDFVDWGTNIGDGKTWRTLTNIEWMYVTQNRTNADSLFGIARINITADGSKYANGVILLPDNWTCPDGISFRKGKNNTQYNPIANMGAKASADFQTFSVAEWGLLENSGAVFLPANGGREGLDVSSVQGEGLYWSATDTWRLGFGAGTLGSGAPNARYEGYSVRLVQDY